MRSSNHIERYRKNCTVLCLTLERHTYTSTQFTFNWDTLVTGHKEGRLPFCSANHCEGQQHTPQSEYVQEFGRTLPSNNLHLLCSKHGLNAVCSLTIL